MKKFTSIAAALALISSIAIAKEVKIGVVLPLTGGVAAFGETSKKGLDIAYEQKINLVMAILLSLLL